jgi:hypothetical protein
MTGNPWRQHRTKNLIWFFSFDSLVHADDAVLAAYIPQILRKLSSVGVAFLHHSNLFEFKGTLGDQHGRSRSVSADLVAALIGDSGGRVLVQEVVNWGGEHLIDCLTLFARLDSYQSTHQYGFATHFLWEKQRSFSISKVPTAECPVRQKECPSLSPQDELASQAERRD